MGRSAEKRHSDVVSTHLADLTLAACETLGARPVTVSAKPVRKHWPGATRV